MSERHKVASSVRIFISHSWQHSTTYSGIVTILNACVPNWHDLSVPIERAEDIGVRARDNAMYQAAMLRRRAADAKAEMVTVGRRLADLDATLVKQQSAIAQLRASVDTARKQAAKATESHRRAWFENLRRSNETMFRPEQRSSEDLSSSVNALELQTKAASDALAAAEERLARTLPELAAQMAKFETDRAKTRDRLDTLKQRVQHDEWQAVELDTKRRSDVRWTEIVRWDSKLQLPLFHFDNVETRALALAIYERIRDCDIVIAACTPDYEYQPWLHFEFQTAAALERPVLAILPTSRGLPANYRYWVTDSLSLPIDQQRLREIVMTLSRRGISSSLKVARGDGESGTMHDLPDRMTIRNEQSSHHPPPQAEWFHYAAARFPDQIRELQVAHCPVATEIADTIDRQDE